MNAISPRQNPQSNPEPKDELSSSHASASEPRAERASLESRTLKYVKTDPFSLLTEDDFEAAINDISVPVFDKWDQPSYRVKVTKFESGDYEVVGVYQEEPISTKKVAKERTQQSRDDMDEEHLMRSVARSKRNIRHKTMQILADRMITLTCREHMDFDKFSRVCDRFIRMFRKRFPARPYVLVFEHHKSGAYHAHMATKGYFNFNSLRRMWHYAHTGKNEILYGSESPGNVDVKNPMKGRDWKPGNLARYISKYTSKDLALGDFNKKRYWASRAIKPPKTYTLFMPSSDAMIYNMSALIQRMTGKKPLYLREFQLGWLHGFYTSTY